MKNIYLLLISFLFLVQSLNAQRVFKEMKNIEMNEVAEYGYSNGFVKMQNDTLLLCRDLSRIEVYDNNQNLLLEYGKKGKGPGELLFILGGLIYKKQLVLLDNVNNKVVYLTFEEEPSLIKEVPILDNGSQIFIINDTLIVRHSLKEYLLAEYNENGEIISSYPELNEDDKFIIFGMNGEMFYENNYFYLFKRQNLEITSFGRKSKIYKSERILKEFNVLENIKNPKVDLSRNSDVQIYTKPEASYDYIYQKVSNKIVVLNIGGKGNKGSDRVLDVYDWSSRDYQYSFVINAELNMGATNMFFPNNINNYYTRLQTDYSIIQVKYTLE